MSDMWNDPTGKTGPSAVVFALACHVHFKDSKDDQATANSLMITDLSSEEQSCMQFKFRTAND